MRRLFLLLAFAPPAQSCTADPLTDPEKVQRVDPGGVIVLASGERLRVSRTVDTTGVSGCEMQGGPLMLCIATGLSGNVKYDIEASRNEIDVQRAGVDADGVTQARVWVRTYLALSSKPERVELFRFIGPRSSN